MLAWGPQGCTGYVIEEDGNQDQTEIGGIPPTVEKEGSPHQPWDGEPMMPALANGKENDERHGQEKENKNMRVKKQSTLSLDYEFSFRRKSADEKTWLLSKERPLF